MESNPRFGDPYDLGYAVAINDALEAVEKLKPLLGEIPENGGYDCCGCSTLDKLLQDSLSAIRKLEMG